MATLLFIIVDALLLLLKCCDKKHVFMSGVLQEIIMVRFEIPVIIMAIGLYLNFKYHKYYTRNILQSA